MKEKKNSGDDMSRTRTIYTTTPQHTTTYRYCKWFFVNLYSITAFVTQNYTKPRHTTITEIISKYSTPHYTTSHPQLRNTRRERERESSKH